MKQILFGALIGLSHHSLIYQPIYQVKQLPPFPSINDYVRITPLTIDATPLNYNAMFTDRTGNNSLIFTFINTQENLNGTKNRTQQDIQTPSHFFNEEIVETMPTTTQQSISPIHSTLTTPKNNSTAFPQTTIQSTVKPFVIPKYSQTVYQTFKPVTTSRQTNKQKTSNRSNFSGHNYNFFAKSKTTKPPYMNNRNQSQAQNYN